MSDSPSLAEVPWSLFNERSRVQIDGLTFDQVWAIIAADDPKQRPSWLVWHRGLTKWRSASDFEESVAFIARAAAQGGSFPAVPDRNDQLRSDDERRVESFEFELAASDVDIDTSERFDSRKTRRYQQRYRVEINVEGVPFYSHTVDISLGGMRLEDELPPTARTSFTASIMHESGQTLTMRCGLIEEIGAPRNRFKISLSDDKALILRTWILENPNQSGFD